MVFKFVVFKFVRGIQIRTRGIPKSFRGIQNRFVVFKFVFVVFIFDGRVRLTALDCHVDNCC